MTDQDYKQIKNFVLDELRNIYVSTTISLWFEDMRVVSLESNEITVSFPLNKKSFVEMKYYDVLKAKFSEVLGFDVDLSLITDEDEAEMKLSMNSEAEEKEENKISAYKIKFNPDYTFENFVVGKANELAYKSAVAVANNPAELNNPLYFYGPSGLGKTHLMFAIVNEIRDKHPDFNILYVTGEEFTTELVEALSNKKPMIFREKYRNVDVLLVDDIQFIGGKMMIQEEFFHTFNTLYENNKQIILAADSPPKDISGLEDRLKTRFNMGLVADIQPPDLELRIAIFQRKAIDYGFKLEMDVLYYLAKSITKNIREIEGALKKLRAHMMISGEKINYFIAKDVLKDFFADNITQESITTRIFEYVQRRYGVGEEELKSSKRNAEIIAARHCAIYLIRETTNLSQKAIAKLFNKKDHTTVMNSLSVITKKMREEPAFEKEIQNIILELRS